MKKDRIIYCIITVIFILISIVILKHTNSYNSVELSKAIELIIICFLIRISYGCAIYIKEQYHKHKYSYGIIMNVGLFFFLNINILRHINLLISNWKAINIIEIYNNTIESFSFFAMLTLPCIAILSIYCIITNIILIKKEGFSYSNLLGIILGSTAIIGLFGSQGIYIFTSKVLAGNNLMLVKKLADIIINAVLSYLYTLYIATLYCNIRASKHTPKFDKDYVIILGCMIRKDGTLTPLLQSRVDKAIKFSKKQKEKSGKSIMFIPSGGQGKDEVISEAEAMKNYLIENGIDEKYIVAEDKSTTTAENLTYSYKIINQNNKDAKVCFSTTNYHVFRSGVIASKCGFDCEGMGSKTKWYFYTNALIREFIANLVQEKKKHLALIGIINISSVILILIGYYFQLLKL